MPCLIHESGIFATSGHTREYLRLGLRGKFQYRGNGERYWRGEYWRVWDGKTETIRERVQRRERNIGPIGNSVGSREKKPEKRV
eukprot:549844-Amorphochlora_amoeboformis.AAC.3